MVAKLQLLWQQIQKYRRAIVVVAIILILVIVIAVIIAAVLTNGTGFNGYDKVTNEFTPGGQLVRTTKEYQPGKTLWDWLGLLAALAIPVVVGIGAAWFTVQQAKASDRGNKDNQREAALQAYINAMSELLLEKHLRTSQPEDEVRTIARVRTITLLFQLD